MTEVAFHDFTADMVDPQVVRSYMEPLGSKRE
jgi:hypothetical protein